ncbi:MAG: GNAT family N-acetyltransferase [Clostridia bacterium]|nr:GNAT family N-acetyltransferase [Clostridia bacterium]
MLETERLILRLWEASDAGDLFRFASDERVGPAAGWRPHTSVEDSRQIIREVLSFPETYAIVFKETGTVIGSIGLMQGKQSHLELSEDEAELGFWVAVPYWGQGIMTEAATELIRHGFEDLGLSRIYCGYFEGNERSAAVQRKLGFQYRKTVPYYAAQLDEERTLIVQVLVNPKYEI